MGADVASRPSRAVYALEVVDIAVQGRGPATFRLRMCCDEEAVKEMIGAAERALGPISMVVNNAGITRDGMFLRMSQHDWDAVLNVNLRGAFTVSKVAARGMMKRRFGAIVNMSSVVGLRGNAGQANTRRQKRAHWSDEIAGARTGAS